MSSSNDVIKPTPGGLAAQFTALAPKNRRPRGTGDRPTTPASARKRASASSLEQTAPDTDDTTSAAAQAAATGSKTGSAGKPTGPAQTADTAAGERSARATTVAKVRRTAFVPLDLHDLAAVHCARMKRNRSQLVLHALAANLQTLEELIAHDAASTAAAATEEEDISDVFPDLEPPRRAAPTRPLPLYFTPDQIERIDAWVTHYGARDRSHLITVALRAYLGHQGASQQKS